MCEILNSVKVNHQPNIMLGQKDFFPPQCCNVTTFIRVGLDKTVLAKQPHHRFPALYKWSGQGDMKG